MYKLETFTYGCELEFADVDINNPLPKGNHWNKKDYTIVNSNGIANDPLGKTCKFGGEINTKPTNTIKKQIKVIENVLSCLDPKPVINYKCNLHIHLGVPDLIKDLESMKKIYFYANTMDRKIFNIIDPIEKPSRLYFPKEEDYQLAKLRYRRNLVSHRQKPNLKTYLKVMASSTPQEFHDNHAINGENGELLWNATPRDAVNLRQLWETNTVEFRHFFGTLDLWEIESCFIWCSEFLNLALNSPNIPPIDILKRHPNLKFPKPKRFDPRLQRGFDFTNVAHRNREEAVKNIEKWLN
jgi:hypothetical protein